MYLRRKPPFTSIALVGGDSDLVYSIGIVFCGFLFYPCFVEQSFGSFMCGNNWAAIWDFQQCGMCDQQRLRPACAYAQSDQSLCKSLEYSMSVKLLTEHHLEFLSLNGGCTGSYESTLVKLSNCWKSHALAQLSFPEEQTADFFSFLVLWLSVFCVSSSWHRW